MGKQFRLKALFNQGVSYTSIDVINIFQDSCLDCPFSRKALSKFKEEGTPPKSLTLFLPNRRDTPHLWRGCISFVICQIRNSRFRIPDMNYFCRGVAHCKIVRRVSYIINAASFSTAKVSAVSLPTSASTAACGRCRSVALLHCLLLFRSRSRQRPCPLRRRAHMFRTVVFRGVQQIQLMQLGREQSLVRQQGFVLRDERGRERAA